tara:strand:- start:339 stop:911 length:573 start_codon:yes stop_codon:yes gene_type:complete
MSDLKVNEVKTDTIKDQTGTTAINIDSSGRVSQPSRPSWLLLGIPNNIGSQGVVIWGQGSHDPGTQSQLNGGCAYDASNGIITIPKTGLYQMSIVFNWRTSASSELFMNLQGSTDNFTSTIYSHGASSSNGYIIAQEFHDHGTEWLTTTWSGLINLNANEKIRLKQSTSLTLTVPTDDSNGGHWSGFFVG